MSYTTTLLDDGRAKITCSECGKAYTLSADKPIRHPCVGGVLATYWPEGFDAQAFTAARRAETAARTGKAAPPSLAGRARNFARAYVQHRKAGSPKATDEQVAARFAVCQSCELFTPKGEGQGICSHKSCGCNLKRVGLAGLNKLRWADQACPVGLWLRCDAPPPTPPA